MEPIRVQSFDEPGVEVFRNIRDADLVGRRGVFIAEGELVVRPLLDKHRERGRFRARSVLLNQTRLGAMGDALAGLGNGCPVYVAEQGVMDEIVGFHIHRGVLACGALEEPMSMPALIEQASARTGPVVVLEDLANHDNVGGVFRNAAAFGASGVLLTKRCCSPLYRKALRVSMGHVLSVPYAIIDSVDEACGALKRDGWTTLALTPDERALPLNELAQSGKPGDRVAILLGAEGPGLTEPAMRSADRLVRIEIEAGVDSLNVVVAGAIALSALRR